jgi:dTDP-4-dehydrorhamnose reductase
MREKRINYNMKTILICGASGQLGSALYEQLHNTSYNVYGTFQSPRPEYLTKKYLFQLDIRNELQVQSLLQKIKPDIIINTAAMTHVDNCESNQKEAYAINVVGNRNLLKYTPFSTLFIYISTYYIFDGTKKTPQETYSELDPVFPINYYAKTKQIAEEDTLKKENSLIIRTSKIYSMGRDQRNFVARLNSSLEQQQKTIQANDQFTNPIMVEMLASSIVTLITHHKTGIYHVGGKDIVSNYQFAMAFADFFHKNKNLIIPTDSSQLPQLILRPKNCALNTEKIEKEGIQLLTLAQSFQYIQTNLNKNGNI